MSDDNAPKRPSSDRLANAMIMLDCLDAIEAELREVLAEMSTSEKLFGVTLNEEQVRVIAKTASRTSSKHIARCVDSAVALVAPKKVQP